MIGIPSVRARLTAWNVGVVALVLVLSGVAVRYLLQASLTTAVEADLSKFGERAARIYPTLDLPKPPTERPRTPDPLRKPPERGLTTGPDLRPRILDRTGQDYRPEGTVGPWDAQAFDRALRGERVFSTITSEGEPLRVYSLPGVKDRQIQGVIQVVEPLAPMQLALSQLTQSLLVLIPAGLLLAALGGAFLTGRALRPVREIAEAASQIQAENLAARLPVCGQDEFARLTHVLNGMLERLNAAFERQQRFTGDASHELRTPLATIKATGSLAYDDGWDAPACHQALLKILRAADRAERIVEGLLLLARADNHTLVSRQIEPASLNLVILGALEVAREGALVRGPHAAVHLDLPAEPRLTVAVDADHLARVFVNLVENALRHTPPDGEIFIEARPIDDTVVVRVRDTGEGIAPEHLPHLTERFYRVDAARSRGRGGAGLGLAICRSIIEAHGGYMQIESEPGTGTEVILTLPSAAIDSSTEPQQLNDQ